MCKERKKKLAAAATAARQLHCLFDLTYVNRRTYLPLFASNTSADIFTYEFICEALPKRQFTVWLNSTAPRIEWRKNKPHVGNSRVDLNLLIAF